VHSKGPWGKIICMGYTSIDRWGLGPRSIGWSSFPLHSSSYSFTVEIYDEVFEYRHFEPQEVPQGGFMTSILIVGNVEHCAAA